MADYLSGFLTGGVVGAAVKWVFELAVKRQQEMVSGRRKMIVGEIEALSKLVDPLMRAGIDYYAQPSREGADLAKRIRVDMKVFARHWESLNNRLPDVGQPKLTGTALVRFRQALTLRLDDSSRDRGLPLDDPAIKAIFDSVDDLHEVFSSAKFKLN